MEKMFSIFSLILSMYIERKEEIGEGEGRGKEKEGRERKRKRKEDKEERR